MRAEKIKINDNCFYWLLEMSGYTSLFYGQLVGTVLGLQEYYFVQRQSLRKLALQHILPIRHRLLTLTGKQKSWFLTYSRKGRYYDELELLMHEQFLSQSLTLSYV